MQKWEYLVAIYEHSGRTAQWRFDDARPNINHRQGLKNYGEALNSLGDDGWQLIRSVNIAGLTEMVFMRAKN